MLSHSSKKTSSGRGNFARIWKSQWVISEMWWQNMKAPTLALVASALMLTACSSISPRPLEDDLPPIQPQERATPERSPPSQTNRSCKAFPAYPGPLSDLPPKTQIHELRKWIFSAGEAWLDCHEKVNYLSDWIMDEYEDKTDE